MALSRCNAAPANSEVSEDVNAAPDVELTRTFDSPEALARAVLEAFHTEDVETLKALALSKEEFRLYVWPKLPSSRHERGIPFDYGWGDLHQKSVGSIASNFSRYKGKNLELLSIAFKDGDTKYDTFTVHRKSEMRVKDTETGEVLTLALFGSVMEYQGRFKLFSYVTD